MLKERGDAGKMGMAAHRRRVRDKLQLWLPKYFKPRGSLGIGQREKCTKASRARAWTYTHAHVRALTHARYFIVVRSLETE